MSYLMNQKSKKSLYLTWTYWLSGKDYRVASLSKRYNKTAKRIILESLKFIVQF